MMAWTRVTLARSALRSLSRNASLALHEYFAPHTPRRSATASSSDVVFARLIPRAIRASRLSTSLDNCEMFKRYNDIFRMASTHEGSAPRLIVLGALFRAHRHPDRLAVRLGQRQRHLRPNLI